MFTALLSVILIIINLNKLISAACDMPPLHKIILGDFNFPDIVWEHLSGKASLESFQNTINDCFLTQIVRQPTQESSILDLVIDSSIFDSVEVIEPLLVSDHNAVMCWVSFNAPDCMNLSVSSHTLELNRAGWALYNSLFGCVNWDDQYVSFFGS